jgi:hypothetical protein
MLKLIGIFALLTIAAGAEAAEIRCFEGQLGDSGEVAFKQLSVFESGEDRFDVIYVSSSGANGAFGAITIAKAPCKHPKISAWACSTDLAGIGCGEPKLDFSFDSKKGSYDVSFSDIHYCVGKGAFQKEAPVSLAVAFDEKECVVIP